MFSIQQQSKPSPFPPSKMAFSLKNSFVSSATYNTLPRLYEVAAVPKDHADDLNALRALLVKHSIPSSVSVRLIHKHFETTDGEVMTFKEVSVPSHGTVYSLGPLNPTQESLQLRPVHYYIDESGSFQAYEYTSAEVLDLSGYQSFLAEFGTLVIERGLQRKLGLKLNSKMDETGWAEFEFRDNRTTIIIPDGMPIPDGIDPDSESNIVTEWGAMDLDGPPLQRVCVICVHTCVSHPTNELQKDTEIYLGGQKIAFGSPVYTIVNMVIEAW
jgi:hypothetical protein